MNLRLIMKAGTKARTCSSLPLSFSSTSSGLSGSSQSVYTLANDGFNITFEHTRGGTPTNDVGSVGNIYFSVDASISDCP